MNTKGVSPLVATILLIAFAVSLGAVIMNLGVNLATSECQDVDTDILHVAGVAKACQTDEQVQFTVANQGMQIKGFRYTITGETDTRSSDVFEQIDELSQYVHRVQTNMNVETLTIIPMIGDDAPTYCTDKQVTVNVATC